MRPGSQVLLKWGGVSEGWAGGTVPACPVLQLLDLASSVRMCPGVQGILGIVE